MKKFFSIPLLLPVLFLGACTPVSTVVNDIQRGLTDAQGIAAILSASGVPDAGLAEGAIVIGQIVLSVLSPALENISNEIASTDPALTKVQKVNSTVSATEGQLSQALTALSATQQKPGLSAADATRVSALIAQIQAEQIVLNAILADVQAGQKVAFSLHGTHKAAFSLSRSDIKRLHQIAQQAAALRQK